MRLEVILRRVLLDKARALQLGEVLVNHPPVLAHLIIHSLEVFRLDPCWTHACLGCAPVSPKLGQSLSEKCLDLFRLDLNLVSDVFNIAVNRLFDAHGLLGLRLLGHCGRHFFMF